jgi:hypothetical protein
LRSLQVRIIALHMISSVLDIIAFPKKCNNAKITDVINQHWAMVSLKHDPTLLTLLGSIRLAYSDVCCDE